MEVLHIHYLSFDKVYIYLYIYLIHFLWRHIFTRWNRGRRDGRVSVEKKRPEV